MDASDVTVELIVGFALGLLLSWSVGLSPAVVYRYLVFREPVEKRKAFWCLAPVVRQPG